MSAPWPPLEKALRDERALAGSLRAAWPRALHGIAFEEDAERLRWWLYENLEQGVPPVNADQLWFRLAPSAWHGRVESCDLELEGGTESEWFDSPLERVTWKPAQPAFGSIVLSLLAREKFDLFESSALAFAALAVQQALRGVHEDLLLGEAPDRGITVSFVGGPGVHLGRFDGRDWDRADFCRIEKAS